VINIFRIAADSNQMPLDSGSLGPLKALYRYLDYGLASRMRGALAHVTRNKSRNRVPLTSPRK
jgi:hypothetical protein